MSSNSFGFYLAIVWRQFIGCGVPIFLTISGYFLSKKNIDTKHSYFTFISKQIPRVYFPCLIWSIPYFIMAVSKGQNIGKSLLILLFCGYSIYYFIILIMQYYILLPFLKTLSTKKGGLIISALISLISLISLFYIDKIKMISLPLVIYAGPFPVWIVFFVLGLYLGKHKINISKSILIIFTIIGLGLSVAETFFNFYITGTHTGLGIKTGAFIYSFAIILLLFSQVKLEPKRSLIWRGITYCGKISFGIYLIHIFILYFVRHLYLILGFDSNVFVNQFITISIVILLCCFIISIMRKINLLFSIKYLGF